MPRRFTELSLIVAFALAAIVMWIVPPLMLPLLVVILVVLLVRGRRPNQQ